MSSCPRCTPAADLAQVTANGFMVAGCHGCGGVFVENDVFKVVVVEPETRAQIVSIMGEAHSHVDESAPVACPACAAPMIRQRAGKIAIDVCKPHGIWFDDAELVQVVEQMRSAGVDAQYTPAVQAMRRNLVANQRLKDAQAAAQMRQQQQGPVNANGEPIAVKKDSGNAVETTFFLIEFVLEIIAALA